MVYQIGNKVDKQTFAKFDNNKASRKELEHTETLICNLNDRVKHLSNLMCTFTDTLLPIKNSMNTFDDPTKNKVLTKVQSI